MHLWTLLLPRRTKPLELLTPTRRSPVSDGEYLLRVIFLFELVVMVVVPRVVDWDVFETIKRNDTPTSRCALFQT